jgi:ubiquinone/menaquinone biosynthesis C-methylase UbiE
LELKQIDYKSDDYHKSRHPEFFENQELFVAWSWFVLKTYFSGIKIKGKTILEYGGALGYNLLQLKEQADVSLIEPSDVGREVATAHGIKSYSNAKEIGDKVFDIILCRHVLEHIPDPLNALSEMQSLLKKGGLLILILPIERQNLKVDREDMNHHLYSWSAQTIFNLANLAGFETDTIRYEYYGMRRKLLPLYRVMGGGLYAKVVRMVGRFLNFSELVVLARKVSK